MAEESIQSSTEKIGTINRRISLLIVFFMAALVLSGITAVPLVRGIDLLVRLFGPGTMMDQFWPAMTEWLIFLQQGLHETGDMYPFMFYGTDWLAYAHIVIAIAFIGPLRDPVRNIWVVEFGLIACVLIIPTALIFGPMRGIPIFWQVIDCAFGVFGFIPLWIVRKDILILSKPTPKVKTG